MSPAPACDSEKRREAARADLHEELSRVERANRAAMVSALSPEIRTKFSEEDLAKLPSERLEELYKQDQRQKSAEWRREVWVPARIFLVLGVFAAFVMTLVRMNWSERRLIAEFAEAFAANLLWPVVTIAPIVAGVLLGRWLIRKSGRGWLGWSLGILATLLLFGLLNWGASEIPGVGWRLEAMAADE